jgi:pyridoxine 4-dehydrogenase
MRASLAEGCNAWNGGENYGSKERNSMHLLNEYITEYPEDAEKIVLSIKGVGNVAPFAVDGSPENVRWSIDNCLKILDGKLKLDLYEQARVDPKVNIEDSIGAIAEYVKAGKVGGISLSEVSANSIRRAAKVHKISAVEVEFSLFTTDILSNGIAEACKELDIPILAYSPLCRGLLSAGWKKPEDVPERARHWPRLQGENFYDNLKLVEQVESIAKSKNATVGQVALGWVLAMSNRNGLPTIIPIPGSTTEERVKENAHPAKLDEEDLAKLDEILKRFETKGTRYPEAGMAMTNG